MASLQIEIVMKNSEKSEPLKQDEMEKREMKETKVFPQGSSGNMVFSERKMDPVSMQSVIDFCEDFGDGQWAIKTFGELLGTADMNFLSNEFNVNKAEVDGYQWGLCQLLELCLERQAAQIGALREKVENSPELLIEHAKKICCLIDEGAFSDPALSSQVSESLNDLDSITTVFGADMYPEAGMIKEQIISRINTGRPRKK